VGSGLPLWLLEFVKDKVSILYLTQRREHALVSRKTRTKKRNTTTGRKIPPGTFSNVLAGRGSENLDQIGGKSSSPKW